MRTLRTFTLKNGFVLPQTPQQPWYKSCFEAVDLERSATASSKNLSLRMAKSGALVFSDLATFTSCLRSMLMIYCTEGVLFGVNLLHWSHTVGHYLACPVCDAGRGSCSNQLSTSALCTAKGVGCRCSSRWTDTPGTVTGCTKMCPVPSLFPQTTQ